MSQRRLAELGQHLASRTRARQLRVDVVRDVSAGRAPIEVDLTDVLSVSDSFADEFFAVLAAERGDEWFRQNIKLVGVSDVVRGSIVRAISARLERSSTSKRASHGPELSPPPADL